jgi:hypothetical protein
MEIYAIIDKVSFKLLYFSIPQVDESEDTFKVTLLDTDFTCNFEDCYYNIETQEFYNL